jgi:hypothetical protein
MIRTSPHVGPPLDTELTLAETRRQNQCAREGKPYKPSPRYLAMIGGIVAAKTGSAPRAVDDTAATKDRVAKLLMLTPEQRAKLDDDERPRAATPAKPIDTSTLALRGQIRRVWPQRTEAEIDAIVASYDNPGGDAA